MTTYHAEVPCTRGEVDLLYRPTEHVSLPMAPEPALRISSLPGSRGVTLPESGSLGLGMTGGIDVLVGSYWFLEEGKHR